jgi:hypothetical protein
MIDLTRTIRLLEAKRLELLNQLQAIDKALAALHGTDTKVSAAEAQPPIVDVPRVTVIKPKRTLSEAHKHAMIEGRRRAREIKRLSSGETETRPDERVPAIAQPTDLTPRLVKRELTVEPLHEFLKSHVN